MIPSVKVLQIIEQDWLDRVVKLAEDTMKSSKVYGKQCSNKKSHWNSPSNKTCSVCQRKTADILQRSQLSNLQNLANSTDSIKALELFILYQMGRKEGKGWKYAGNSDRSFGLLVISDFNTLKQWAEQIANDSGETDSKATHLWLIRLYCGFLNRWFVALKGSEEETEYTEEE